MFLCCLKNVYLGLEAPGHSLFYTHVYIYIMYIYIYIYIYDVYIYMMYICRFIHSESMSFTLIFFIVKGVSSKRMDHF